MSPGIGTLGRSARALGAALFFLASSALWAAPPTPQSTPKYEAPPGSEGQLNNDCYLPTSQAAQERLEAGDEALLRARAAQGAGDPNAERYLTECIDAWHAALTLSEREASVWVALSRGPQRTLSEGLRYALERRLRGLTPGEIERWTERLEALALPALEAAQGNPQALKVLAQRFPWTRSAKRAALALADIARERGAHGEAGTWLRRARSELPQGSSTAGDDGALQRAIQRRIEALPQPQEPPKWGAEGRFRLISALSLGPAGRSRLSNPGGQSQLDRGPRPGLVFLSKTRIAVQDELLIHLLRLDERGNLELERSFDPTSLSFANGAPLPFDTPRVHERRARRAPGWQLAPSSLGTDLFLVAGQTEPEEQSNALFSISLPPQPLPGSLLLPGQSREPVVNWVVLGDEWVDREGVSRKVGRLSGLLEMEFQPGPVVHENRVLVQARTYGDDVRSWLMCLDRHSGQLQWNQLLGAGADLLEEQRRLNASSRPRLSAPPLTLIRDPAGLGDRLFVSTNLGFGALVDLVDGWPLWSLKNRRRSEEALGWDGYGSLLSQETDRSSILWAGFDSDRLYSLRAEPLSGSELKRSSVLAQRPLPIGESRTLLGGDAQGIVVQGRAGGERTLSELSSDPDQGSKRVDALYLGPGEEFAGRGLMNAERVLVCTERGLYDFDRTRELYLLGYTALPRSQGNPVLSPGGDLYVQAGTILALGKNGIWSFRGD